MNTLLSLSLSLLLVAQAQQPDPALKKEFEQKRDALQGKDPDAHVKLGDWCVEKSLKEEAKWCYQKAWDLQDGIVGAKEGMKKLGCDLDGKIFRPATEIAEKRKKALKKNDVDGLYEIAEYLKDFGLEKESKKLLDECLKMDPEHKPTRVELGFRRWYGEWLTEKQYEAEKKIDDAWQFALDLKKSPEETLGMLKAAGYKGSAADVQRILKMTTAPTGYCKDVKLETAPGDLTNGRYTYGTPDGYKPWHKSPLLIFLVGGINGTGDGTEAFNMIWPRSSARGWLTIGPTVPETVINYPWNTDKCEKFLRAILREFSTKYNVDPQRIYLAGQSGGGSGVWYLGSRMMDVFAALGPWAGETVGANIAALKSVPTYIIHNARDTEVPIAGSRSAGQALAGPMCVYVEPDSDKNAIAGPEQDKALSWMEKWKKRK